jgi:hypothetical protein
MLLRAPRKNAWALPLLWSPMDSVRYFELPFAWDAAKRRLPDGGRYLDVSSPRGLPMAILRARRGVTAELVNPDGRDLEQTALWARSAGVSDRCSLRRVRAARETLAAGTYDFVTCISVLEHVPEPEDEVVLAAIWAAVRRGGSLVLTVPCAKRAFDEYVDFDEYQLGVPEDAGFVFGQRFYDERLLEQRIFSICGRPVRRALFGEREPGAFIADRARKNTGAVAPEREPYEVARSYREYESIGAMPGWGVVALEFVQER